MSFTDVFNAVVGYYLIVLAVSAAAGVRETLRDPAAASAALAASSGSGSSPTAGASAPTATARTRFGVLVHGRSLHAAHRFGWATGAGAALGWATGLEVYRAGRRATIAGAARARDWRERRRAAAVDAGLEPDAVTPPTPATPSAPDPAAPSTPANPAPGSPDPGPSAPDAAITDAELVDGEPAAPEAAPGLDPVQAALTARPGRPPLYLVPPPQEYPKIMPAAEIYDMESLVNFTGQVTDATVLESEDAAAASASMIAGAEFAGNTALRVADETTSLEGAVAAMAALRVDPESTAAYNALLEAGQVYRDITATFSVQCHDAAATAGQMATAAANYHETATAALAVLNAHQMPHAEAAQATGHSGAHGTFYGVPDTGGQDALTGAGAPQLPAS